MHTIQAGDRYKHFKGKESEEYEIIGIAKHSETLEEMVVYKALYDEGQLWVRPLPMFLDMKKNEDGTEVQRFTKIG